MKLSFVESSSTTSPRPRGVQTTATEDLQAIRGRVARRLDAGTQETPRSVMFAYETGINHSADGG